MGLGPDRRRGLIAANVALGIAEIANVSKAASGASSISTTSTPSLGSPSNPVFASTSTSDSSTTSGAQQTSLQLIVQGNLFASSETVDWLMDELKDRINNRDSIIINGNSAQASELFDG